MKVCIAGGGKVGFYLARTLLAHGHTVTLIDPDEAQCRYLADSLDIPVVCGNSIRTGVLRAAGCAECDTFVAVTGSDEDNLVACQLAKEVFGIGKTVARASNPQNRELLRLLGVDIVVCGTDSLSHILEREIETDSIRQLLPLAGGRASLDEIILPDSFALAGTPVAKLSIPGEAILVSVTRNGELIIPHGSTTLAPGDRILCLTQGERGLHDLAAAWGLDAPAAPRAQHAR